MTSPGQNVNRVQGVSIVSRLVYDKCSILSPSSAPAHVLLLLALLCTFAIVGLSGRFACGLRAAACTYELIRPYARGVRS